MTTYIMLETLDPPRTHISIVGFSITVRVALQLRRLLPWYSVLGLAGNDKATCIIGSTTKRCSLEISFPFSPSYHTCYHSQLPCIFVVIKEMLPGRTLEGKCGRSAPAGLPGCTGHQPYAPGAGLPGWASSYMRSRRSVSVTGYLDTLPVPTWASHLCPSSTK